LAGTEDLGDAEDALHDACGGVFEAEEMADLVGDHVGEQH
jgi:hypothetical protein